MEFTFPGTKPPGTLLLRTFALTLPFASNTLSPYICMISFRSLFGGYHVSEGLPGFLSQIPTYPQLSPPCFLFFMAFITF